MTHDDDDDDDDDDDNDGDDDGDDNGDNNSGDSNNDNINNNNDNNNNDDGDSNDDSNDDDSDDNINDNNDNDNDDDNSDNDKLCNFSDKVLNNSVIVFKIKNSFSINIEKIIALINKAGNISKDDFGLKLDEYKKLNILADELINLIWVLIYGEDRVDNEINNIDVDKEKDANGYVHKYINIVNDKISLLNNVSESTDDLMGGIDVNTSNDIAPKKLKDFKSHIAKLINRFNLYIKQDTKKKDTKNNTEPDIKNNTKKNDTKNNTKPDTKNNTKKKDSKNNTKPDTENDIEWDINDTRESIRKNQIIIKSRYKSLLETRKTIRNNIDSVYSGLKKLPRQSQLKANQLIKLDTILNDSINVIWREIHDRDKKVIKKIDINKIKNVDSFIYELKDIINHKILLLKSSVIVKLNVIISDIKNKSNIDDIYNYSNKDKLFMIYIDLEKYMKHLKRDLGTIKQNLKTILIHIKL